ncbi:MAG: GTPase HflX [Clostridia bacterium]|nr:GTPase HflX [Clostridia bacterium]
MHNNLVLPDQGILVGVGVNQIFSVADLDELALLCQTCNIETVGRVIQNRKDVDVTYYIGKGKVEEIKNLIETTKANVVVFDVELSGSKVRNLERELGVPVLDRSKVILDIFAARAQSAAGKLQVELAQLRYNLPRLIGSGGLMSKMRNGVGMRGPGEKKLELDKRLIHDEISALEKKLEEVKKARNVAGRQRYNQRRVCLDGYTNSGKSTLFNLLTKAGVYAKDELFATLDTTTRAIYLNGKNFVLTDTVGFINHLPHEFINAFEATLDETREADLLIHVVDCANSTRDEQIKVVNQVLKNIGADKIPQLLVYNKIDKNPDFVATEGSVVISAIQKTGIEKLKETIFNLI